MRDSKIKHCQLWREHCYAAKAKTEYRRKVFEVLSAVTFWGHFHVILLVPAKDVSI